jgi:hypothetical protein
LEHDAQGCLCFGGVWDFGPVSKRCTAGGFGCGGFGFGCGRGRSDMVHDTYPYNFHIEMFVNVQQQKFCWHKNKKKTCTNVNRQIVFGFKAAIVVLHIPQTNTTPPSVFAVCTCAASVFQRHAVD